MNTGESFRDGFITGRGSFKRPDGAQFTGHVDGGRPTRGVLVEADGRQYDVTYAADSGMLWNSPCKSYPQDVLTAPNKESDPHNQIHPLSPLCTHSHPYLLYTPTFCHWSFHTLSTTPTL